MKENYIVKIKNNMFLGIYLKNMNSFINKSTRQSIIISFKNVSKNKNYYIGRLYVNRGKKVQGKKGQKKN